MFLSPHLLRKLAVFDMRRAFTLIETLVSVALFAIAMLAVTQLYTVFWNLIEFQNPKIEVALGANSIVGAVHTLGLQATSIVESHVFFGTSYSSGATTAIFEIPAIDASGNIISGVYDYAAVLASSTSAYRLIDAAPTSARVSETKQLTRVLGALMFVYNNPDFALATGVTVDATTSATAKGQTIQAHLRARAYLRNL